MVLVLCTSSVNALYLYQDLLKYLIGRVMVLVLCTSSDGDLYLYQVS